MRSLHRIMKEEPHGIKIFEEEEQDGYLLERAFLGIPWKFHAFSSLIGSGSLTPRWPSGSKRKQGMSISFFFMHIFPKFFGQLGSPMQRKESGNLSAVGVEGVFSPKERDLISDRYFK